MREVYCSPNDVAELDVPVHSVEWNESPSYALEIVSEALAAHGLQVVLYEDGTDTTSFSIEKRA